MSTENTAEPSATTDQSARSIGQLVDQLGTVRERKRELSHEAKALQKQEDELRELINQAMLDSSVRVLGGQLFRATAVATKNYTVNDWQQLYGYIVEHDAFELLHKRLGVSAAEEHIELIGNLPGVEVSDATEIKVTRLRSI